MGRISGIRPALIVSLGLMPQLARAGDASEFFETKVRPVLATHCISCHGPAKQKAGLRLDTSDGMKKGGESGAVVVAGNPEKSRLVDAVTYHDTDLQMPPKGKLADAEIEAIARWVKAGAVWPEATKDARPTTANPDKSTVVAGDRGFWSFQPVKRVEPPVVKDGAWSKTPIDRFVFAAMTTKGLAPSPRADKRTLIRRATFDLTGLPPTVEEVEAFIIDNSPEAFAKVVDRLLASPRYGERWARHWLDLARYGEDQAHTFQARLFPQGYLYRDWVVNALNADMPYDRFLIEQIAGDLAEGSESDREGRLAALGLFGLGASYYSGSPTAIADERDDKIDTLCRATLGLTVACARCHDHKFDPISTADYYSLTSIMASTVYKEYPRASAAEVAKYDQAQAAIKAKTDEIAALLQSETPKVSERLAVLTTARYVVAAWSFSNAKKLDPKLTSATFVKRNGRNDIEVDWLDRWVGYLYDKKAVEGRPHLARWRTLIDKDDPKLDLSTRPEERAKAQAVGDALQEYIKATVTLRDALKSFEAAEKALAPNGQAPAARPKLSDADLKALKELAATDGPFRLRRGDLRIAAYLDVRANGEFLKKQLALETLKKGAPGKYAVIHAVADATTPTTLRVHLRGNPATLGDEAPRRFLSAIPVGGAKPFTKGSGRLELARAIASKDNPLTARVIVNRLWNHHFGRGIVATPSNFGAMGDRPSHPELLDWLAARLIETGWSLKTIHREIMLTSAYAQASEPGAKARETDGDNIWLSHFGRHRLEVEAWRDAMLAVTGELDPKLGGPSIDLGSSDNRRRTLYARISRHKLDPLLRQFDFPDPNLTSDRRNVSTVPLQGLFVLNSDFMNRRAEALAAGLTKDGKEADDARIRRAFLRLYGRPAADDEVAMGVEFLKGSGTPEKGAPSAWVQYAQVLLGSNEFLFVD
jgi:mono/diheme cytochrome c family protein